MHIVWDHFFAVIPQHVLGLENVHVSVHRDTLSNSTKQLKRPDFMLIDSTTGNTLFRGEEKQSGFVTVPIQELVDKTANTWVYGDRLQYAAAFAAAQYVVSLRAIRRDMMGRYSSSDLGTLNVESPRDRIQLLLSVISLCRWMIWARERIPEPEHPDDIVRDSGIRISVAPNCVVKKYPESERAAFENCRNSLKILADARVPNVIRPGNETDLQLHLHPRCRWLRLSDASDYYGPADTKEALQVLFTVCVSLIAAHDAGLVHCDLRWANVLLAYSGEAIVIDWDDSVHLGMDESRTLDRLKLLYARTHAPELCRDGHASRAADLWGFGLLITQARATLPDSVLHLGSKLMSQSPAERPSFDRVKDVLESVLAETNVSALTQHV